MVDERLSDKIDKTNELLLKMLDDRNMPKEKKFGIGKLSGQQIKKGFVLVLLLKSNNNIVVRKLQVINGNIYLKENETFHLAETDYIGIYKKWPVVILPEWSNEPLSKEMLIRKIDENKSSIKPQQQIIHLMEDAKAAELTKAKKSIRGLVWIVLGIGAIYLAGKQLGWF